MTTMEPCWICGVPFDHPAGHAMCAGIPIGHGACERALVEALRELRWCRAELAICDRDHDPELGCTGRAEPAPVAGGAAEDAYQFGQTLRDPEWARVACYDRSRRRAIWARYRADQVALRCGREGDDGLVTLRLGATVDADMLRRLRSFFDQASMAAIHDDGPAMVEMLEAAVPEREP